jgi:hypothetical protein
MLNLSEDRLGFQSFLGYASNEIVNPSTPNQPVGLGALSSDFFYNFPFRVERICL